MTKKVRLVKDAIELYPEDLPKDFVYRIDNEERTPIGILYLSEYVKEEIYIEWIEFLMVFRGNGYLRAVFKALQKLYPGRTIRFKSRDEYLKKYLKIGCEEHGICELTELHIMTYEKRL